ncbi:alpha/beta hydrolase [Marinobacterium jannaschii]|uniref:alpha/beta hydrolase n=1 Tax=Marinobacterium jannaschii TaxID=64970 RepID=UPI000684CB13|nr:alpha/beta hydrolase [Marinobacterium jannaschii]
MTGFDRTELLAQLPRFQLSDSIACESSAVQAYRCFYRLQSPFCSQHLIGLEALAEATLAVQLFRPVCPVRGTVVLLHGYLDHAGLYHHLIHALLAQGWQVLIHDLEGHGLSSGAPNGIDSFSRYANDLSTLLQRYDARLQSPWVMMGQSTGAAVLLEQARLHFELLARWPVQQHILLAPLIRPTQYEMIRRKYRWLGRILKQVPRAYSESSHDADFSEFVRERDPLQHHRISVQWIGAMLRWIDQIEACEQLPVTARVIQGTDDNTVEWQHNLPLLDRLLRHNRVELIEGACHHLVNESEPYRKQLLQHISDSLQQQGQGVCTP